MFVVYMCVQREQQRECSKRNESAGNAIHLWRFGRTFESKETPTPGGVSYLLCSHIKKHEWEDPPRSTWYKFFEGGPLTHGSWWGNIVNRKPPRGGGGGSFDQYRTKMWILFVFTVTSVCRTYLFGHTYIGHTCGYRLLVIVNRVCRTYLFGRTYIGQKMWISFAGYSV